MIRRLLKYLFTTFILSVVVSIAVICIYYAAIHKGGNYSRAVPLIIKGALYLNFMMLLLSSPVLFLSFPNIFKNSIIRFILYFSGPIVFIIAAISFPPGTNKTIYLLTSMVFIIIHSVFYYKLSRKQIID